MSVQPTYNYVVNGAKIKCSAGSSQGTLSLPVSHGFDFGENGLLNVQDHASLTNIGSMGSCKNQNNIPCIPLTPAPWLDGNDNLLVVGAPALSKKSLIICSKGGIIKIEEDGQQ